MNHRTNMHELNLQATKQIVFSLPTSRITTYHVNPTHDLEEPILSMPLTTVYKDRPCSLTNQSHDIHVFTTPGRYLRKIRHNWWNQMCPKHSWKIAETAYVNRKLTPVVCSKQQSSWWGTERSSLLSHWQRRQWTDLYSSLALQSTSSEFRDLPVLSDLHLHAKDTPRSYTDMVMLY